MIRIVWRLSKKKVGNRGLRGFSRIILNRQQALSLRWFIATFLLVVVIFFATEGTESTEFFILLFQASRLLWGYVTIMQVGQREGVLDF
jgi:hypothetical protein